MKLQEETRGLADVLVSFWWISWLGIFLAFLYIGGRESWHEFYVGSSASYFSLTLLMGISLAWVVFIAVGEKVGERKPVVVNLLTLMGTFLAIFSLFAIFFFGRIAPRIP